MSKFETLYNEIYEATGITGAPSATDTSAQANTPQSPNTAGVTAQTPVTNTPQTFDQQHPLVQALAKINDPAAVAKLLQDNKIVLPAAQGTPTPNAA
jgi:hypothetical protein